MHVPPYQGLSGTQSIQFGPPHNSITPNPMAVHPIIEITTVETRRQ